MYRLRFTAFAAGLLTGLNTFAIPVLGTRDTPVDLGFFDAGTYQLTGSGVVDLCGGFNRFSMRPDGTPNAPVTCQGFGPQFNPNGSFTVDGVLGPAGMNGKIGALVGTLNPLANTNPNPTIPQANQWFLIGYGTTVVLANPSHIYAMVNEIRPHYHDNIGAFDVTVSLVPVPEPSTYALLAAGLVVVGAVARRRAEAQA